MTIRRQFLTAVLANLARAELECSSVLMAWYPEMPACSSMVCEGDLACVISIVSGDYGDCAQFQCKNKASCPAGTNYYPFYPEINEDQGDQVADTSGFACYPPEFEPEEQFSCEFDSQTFELTVDAQVAAIVRKHDYDERNITLISWEKYQQKNDSGPWLIFDETECRGVEDPETGLVKFDGVKNGENDCYFTNIGLDVDEIEVPYYVQKFVIGYDDLVDFKPNGSPVYKRYGKNWIVNCRIKAWDTGYVNPGATGERDEKEIITQTEIDFKFEMFRDDTFTTLFSDGDTLDIGADSIEDQFIFVQAEAEIANPNMDMAMHLKYCKVQEIVQSKVTLQWDIVADEFDFMVDGCLSTLPFIQNNFDQKASRVQWADPDEKTYVIDQFKVDLWDPQIDDAEEIKVFFECTMTLCSLPAFTQPAVDQSMCRLPADACTDRYDNLQAQARRRRSTVLKSEDERVEVERSKTENFAADLTFKRNLGQGTGEIPSTNDPDSSDSSSAKMMLTWVTVFVLFALFA